jgi:hypothetical protein
MKVFQVLDVLPKNGIIVREEGDIIRVFFDIEKMAAETSKSGEVIVPDGMCSMENVDISGTRTYDGIVNAIVCDHYPADKMQAIINNHLLESESKEHQAEFAEMQAWRVKAKSVAKEVVTMIV